MTTDTITDEMRAKRGPIVIIIAMILGGGLLALTFLSLFS